MTGLSQTNMLLKEEKAILKKIRDSDTKTLLTGKDENGISFLIHIFRLHKKIFGEACSSCPNKISGYIQKLKKFNSDTMKTAKNKDAKFILAPDTLLVFAGTSRSYSEYNITDEVALEYLSKNPNRRTLFSKVPKNLEELIEDFITDEAKPKVVIPENVVPIVPLFPMVESNDKLSIGTIESEAITDEAKPKVVIPENVKPKRT
jgi:hypothetical protein